MSAAEKIIAPTALTVEQIAALPATLTVDEAGRLLRMDRRTIYGLLDAGDLESNGRSGKGRPIRIWTASLIDYVRGKRRAS